MIDGSRARLWTILATLCLPMPARAQGAAQPEAAALARPRQAEDRDVVALSSGNRMTGTVEELERGLLSFAVDGAGSVEINWRNVESLESRRRLDIELASGERLSGSIFTSGAGTLEVRTDATSRTVSKDDVIRLTPLQASFRERTSGSVDAGLALLNANHEFDVTLNAGAEHRTRHFLTEASLSLLMRRLENETAQRRNHLALATRRFAGDRWFGLGRFDLEENRELDVDLRWLVGVAPGRTLVQTHRTLLSVYAGVDYARTDYRGIAERENLAEALATLEWDWFERGGTTAFDLEATTYLGLNEPSTRLDIASHLRQEFFRNFYWSLNYYLSYESDSPVDGGRSDYALGLTLGRSF